MPPHEEYDTIQMSDEEIKKAFVRCFISKEGKIVLSYLRRQTIERCLGADAEDRHLRDLEGQRRLVRQIEQLSDIN